MTDATRHGLFRPLRRATSRTPVPGPNSRQDGEQDTFVPTFLRSAWLRSAFGLESHEAAPRVPPGPSEGWPRSEEIVEPVWILELDGLD